MKAYWSRYRRITGTASGQTPPEDTYAVKIRAKKRCIDPLVRTGSGAKRLTDLEQECEKAVMQIDDRMYAKTLEDRYDQVSCFGIAFYKRRCLIQKK